MINWRRHKEFLSWSTWKSFSCPEVVFQGLQDCTRHTNSNINKSTNTNLTQLASLSPVLIDPPWPGRCSFPRIKSTSQRPTTFWLAVGFDLKVLNFDVSTWQAFCWHCVQVCHKTVQRCAIRKYEKMNFPIKGAIKDHCGSIWAIS